MKRLSVTLVACVGVQLGITAAQASPVDQIMKQTFSRRFPFEDSAEGSGSGTAQGISSGPPAAETGEEDWNYPSPLTPDPRLLQVERPASPAPRGPDASRQVSPPVTETAAIPGEAGPAAATPDEAGFALASYGVSRMSSTAYCLTGLMASGRPMYRGAAAMNGVPLGSRYQVLDGPRSGEKFTIEDRIGRGSSFDIAYPGNCRAASLYGRRVISIRRI